VLYLGEAYGPNYYNTIEKNIINPNISIKKNKDGTWYRPMVFTWNATYLKGGIKLE